MGFTPPLPFFYEIGSLIFPVIGSFVTLPRFRFPSPTLIPAKTQLDSLPTKFTGPFLEKFFGFFFPTRGRLKVIAFSILWDKSEPEFLPRSKDYGFPI